MNKIDLSVELTFKSINYIVNFNSNDTNLALEIQNVESTECWRGLFDKKYIEDLTRKTGNFKSFPIFVNMLQSALTNETSTVSLDLLTFSDLENLKNKSNLNCSNVSSLSRSSSQQNQSNHRNNKKYLIMTYNVEFDRINYPLQLRYQGVLDPSSLLEQIRNLKNEIKLLQSNRNVNINETKECIDFKKEIKRLELENETLKKENESLEMELLKLSNGNSSCVSSFGSNQMENRTLKELNALKKMMKTFEEDALKEKNSYLKQMLKKNEEINQLKNQMNKMIENERNMVNKLKILRELEQSRGSKINSRSSSKDSTQRINYVSSQRQHQSRIQSNSLDRFSKSSSRFQSNSLDRFSRASRTSSRKVSVSPAPSSRRSSSKRFDPTEYCRQKKSKLEEINMQKRKEIQAKMNISSEDCSKKSLSSSNQRLNNKPTSSVSKRISRAYENNINYEYLNSSVSINQSNEENCINHKQQMPRTSNNSIKNYNHDQEMRVIDEKLKSLHNLFKYSI